MEKKTEPKFTGPREHKSEKAVGKMGRQCGLGQRLSGNIKKTTSIQFQCLGRGIDGGTDFVISKQSVDVSWEKKLISLPFFRGSDGTRG